MQAVDEMRHYVARKAKEEAEVDTVKFKSRQAAAIVEATGAGGLPAQGGAGTAGAGQGKAKRPGKGKAKKALEAPPNEF